MPNYAQINYKQFVGNSHLGIDEIGCFLAADCYLLDKIHVEIDPPTLNSFYESHSLYTYDLTDKANDDITWSTVTKYCPQLVVSQIGGAGFPNSDLAQVEFRYKSHTGLIVTHFCAVHSAADHSIIDSYDGQIKTPAQYESVYGQPIAWATFVYHTPEVTPPGPAAAPISAPAAVASVSVTVTAEAPIPAVAPAPAPAPVAPKQLYLPPSVWIWHVYKPGGPWTLPYAIGALDPKMFNGLTYNILGNPAPNIYLIQTETFGEVAIYAGPDTVAQFPGSGHGEGESTTLEVAQAAGVPVSEVVPAPAPAAPVVPEVPADPAVTYKRFEEPLSLVTKEGAQSVNFISGTIVDTFETGTPFEAVGKAVLPNNDTYFMNETNFGTADQTQQTPITVGIKTSYLEWPKQEETPAPAPAPAPAAPITVQSVAQPQENSEPTSTPPAFTPTLPWQGTFERFPNKEVIRYYAKEDMQVYSFVTGNDRKNVTKNTPVDVIGTFIYGGRRMYLPKSSSPQEFGLGGSGTWYGFPVATLKRQDAATTPFESNDDINKLDHEIQQEISKTKRTAIKVAGTSSGWLARFNKRSN